MARRRRTCWWTTAAWTKRDRKSLRLSAVSARQAGRACGARWASVATMGRSAPGTTGRSRSRDLVTSSGSCRCGRRRRSGCVGAGMPISSLDLLAVGFDFVQARNAGLQPAQRLLEGLGKLRPIAITSPTDFICVVRRGLPRGTSRRRNGDLGDHVVDRRLEGRRAWRRR